MSDGNFNRSHLPKNDYQSGVRAGKVIERNRALYVFSIFLSQEYPNLSETERLKYQKLFQQLLDSAV